VAVDNERIENRIAASFIPLDNDKVCALYIFLIAPIKNKLKVWMIDCQEQYKNTVLGLCLQPGSTTGRNQI